LPVTFAVVAEAFIVGLVELTVAGMVVVAGELGLAVDRVDAGFDVDENTYTGVAVFDVKNVVGIGDVVLGVGVVSATAPCVRGVMVQRRRRAKGNMAILASISVLN
jgi:hypothetical protein